MRCLEYLGSLGVLVNSCFYSRSGQTLCDFQQYVGYLRRFCSVMYACMVMFEADVSQLHSTCTWQRLAADFTH